MLHVRIMDTVCYNMQVSDLAASTISFINCNSTKLASRFTQRPLINMPRRGYQLRSLESADSVQDIARKPTLGILLQAYVERNRPDITLYKYIGLLGRLHS